MLEFQIFQKHHELRYGLSQKSDGPMGLGKDILHSGIFPKNREVFFKNLGIPLNRLVGTELIHDAHVKIVDEKDGGKVIGGTDGLVTNIGELFLTIGVADCFPLYFYAPDARVVGLVHVGWRGLLRGIISTAIDTMVKRCGVLREKLLVGIGPGIQRCHFEIKKDLVPRFEHYRTSIIKRDNKIFVDLEKIILEQFHNNGLLPNNIESSSKCTYCLEDIYFSYRRDKPLHLQTMLAYIGMVKNQTFKHDNI